ncbi:hypothetical protein [Teredinibacter sp. KSP-S5-2]|uniref:hypothetical protein n=1 Tax=Teredinibacter sp. KSP-S5-2 TaxID=3034506 RepID=UPI002934BA3C|nr:hypothetical protein [Teredinibacter sp. KSP-S5-2]WNO10147.1 hypothetical protein P5V12_03075 [Teredinibacter sp. KSP-S5-2]
MDNKDLVWDLEQFQKRKRAENFVLGFENKLCVYSGSVEQLYTNYDIFFPKDENHKLVILPNPYAAHDTFHGIEEASVKATGIFIVPSDPRDEKGRLSMMIPLKGSDAGKRNFRRVPLDVGLKLINQHRPSDKPFLPVLIKGDLRELDADTPCLHLHSLLLSDLPKLSALEVKDIQSVVLERLQELAGRV